MLYAVSMVSDDPVQGRSQGKGKGAMTPNNQMSGFLTEKNWQKLALLGRRDVYLKYIPRLLLGERK